MTAKSGGRRKRVRFAAMETLGFYDTPSTQTTGQASTNGTAPAAVQSPPPPTTTEETLENWKPSPPNRHLQKRTVRWGVIASVVGLAAIVGGLSFWIYQRPTTAAEIAVSQVSDQADTLDAALQQLTPMVDALIAGESIDGDLLGLVTLEVTDAARDLYSLAGELPASETAARTAASDAASLALDASRLVSDLTTYQSALAPNLIPPALETDSSLVDLTAAAKDYGDWQARLTRIRSALPTGVAAVVTAEFDVFFGKLDAARSDYLDALREGERFAARAVGTELENDLNAISDLLDITIAEQAAIALSEIETARAGLADLIG